MTYQSRSGKQEQQSQQLQEQLYLTEGIVLILVADKV